MHVTASTDSHSAFSAASTVRGVSKDGAIRAEALFGCSTTYVLTGEGPRAPAAGPGRRETVIADMLRNSATLREVARMQELLPKIRDPDRRERAKEWLRSRGVDLGTMEEMADLFAALDACK